MVNTGCGEKRTSTSSTDVESVLSKVPKVGNQTLAETLLKR